MEHMKKLFLAGIMTMFVTAAVTAEAWYIGATVNDNHASVYSSPDLKRIPFPSKAACTEMMTSSEFKRDVVDEFTQDEQNAHGEGVKIVWVCFTDPEPGLKT